MFLAGQALHLEAPLGLGALEGLAIVVAEGSAEAQAGEVFDPLPVEREVLAVEQVVAALDHRVADEEACVALGAAQPDRAAVAFAAFGQAQGAGPG